MCFCLSEPTNEFTVPSIEGQAGCAQTVVRKKSAQCPYPKTAGDPGDASRVCGRASLIWMGKEEGVPPTVGKGAKVIGSQGNEVTITKSQGRNYTAFIQLNQQIEMTRQ